MRESDTVMRALEANADVSTRYGGGFVQAIDGIEAQERFGRSRDWFFFVNGVESTVGAADFPLRGGEAIWWDYRDWEEAMRVPWSAPGPSRFWVATTVAAGRSRSSASAGARRARRCARGLRERE